MTQGVSHRKRTRPSAAPLDLPKCQFLPEPPATYYALYIHVDHP
jgi:hypothetical protein